MATTRRIIEGYADAEPPTLMELMRASTHDAVPPVPHHRPDHVRLDVALVRITTSRTQRRLLDALSQRDRDVMLKPPLTVAPWMEPAHVRPMPMHEIRMLRATENRLAAATDPAVIEALEARRVLLARLIARRMGVPIREDRPGELIDPDPRSGASPLDAALAAYATDWRYRHLHLADDPGAHQPPDLLTHESPARYAGRVRAAIERRSMKHVQREREDDGAGARAPDAEDQPADDYAADHGVDLPDARDGLIDDRRHKSTAGTIGTSEDGRMRVEIVGHDDPAMAAVEAGATMAQLVEAADLTPEAREVVDAMIEHDVLTHDGAQVRRGGWDVIVDALGLVENEDPESRKRAKATARKRWQRAQDRLVEAAIDLGLAPTPDVVEPPPRRDA